MSPEVSVIVATYNQSATIARTLDSILAQECDFDFEIIIGEDCSTDDTLDICRRYARAHPRKIRVFHNAVNKGIVDNYFDCITECRGKYIADCPGDDYWVDSHKLQKQYAILEADPEVTLVHTAWNCVNHATGETLSSDPDNKNARHHRPMADGRSLLLPILCHTRPPVIHLATAMYRAEIIRNACAGKPQLFRDKAYRCEDLQIITALAAAGKVAYIPDITLNYTIGHSSISNPDDPQSLFDYHTGIIKLTSRLAEHYGIERRHLQAFITERLRYVTGVAFNSLDRSLIIKSNQLMKEHGVAGSVKTRLINALSSNNMLWRISVNINKIHHHGH